MKNWHTAFILVSSFHFTLQSRENQNTYALWFYRQDSGVMFTTSCHLKRSKACGSPLLLTSMLEKILFFLASVTSCMTIKRWLWCEQKWFHDNWISFWAPFLNSLITVYENFLSLIKDTHKKLHDLTYLLMKD